MTQIVVIAGPPVDRTGPPKIVTEFKGPIPVVGQHLAIADQLWLVCDIVWDLQRGRLKQILCYASLLSGKTADRPPKDRARPDAEFGRSELHYLLEQASGRRIDSRADLRKVLGNKTWPSNRDLERDIVEWMRQNITDGGMADAIASEFKRCCFCFEKIKRCQCPR